MSVYVAIIGIDGSGKSSCFRGTLERLAERSLVAGVGDGIWLGEPDRGLREIREGRWALGKRVLGRLAKRSRQKTLYQITKFPEMLCRVNVQNTIEGRHGPGYVVTDGAPLINMIGWASFYHPRYFERDECAAWVRYLCRDETVPLSRVGFYLKHIPGVVLINRLRLARFRRPDVVCFLRVSPEVAIERIKARSEERQIHETMEFLRRLDEAYDLVCGLLEDEFGVNVQPIRVDDLSVADTVSEIVERLPRP